MSGLRDNSTHANYAGGNMLAQLLESLFARLREYFDLERLGLLLGELLVNIIIASIVLAVFYLLWRVLNRIVSNRLELREKIFKALTVAGVEMPFETIQLAPHRVTVGMSANKKARVPNDSSD